MPHKVTILPHLDALTEEGRDVGACNTVFVREELHPSTGQKVKHYIGTNTDVVGVRDALFKAVDRPQETYYGKPALVVGGGGAARSAVYALRKYLHASQIYLINRLDSEVAAIITECEARGFGYNLTHVKTPQEAARLGPPAAVVACVPDIEPRTREELNARATTEVFLNKHDKGVWLEMAYHPTIWTGLAVAARDAGWRVVLGTEAMIWQGLEQDRLWTGRNVIDMGVEQVRKIVNEAVERSNNAHHS